MMNHTETVHELVKDLMNRLAITESIEDIVKEYKKKDDSPDSFSRFISGLLGIELNQSRKLMIFQSLPVRCFFHGMMSLPACMCIQMKYIS